MQILNISLPIQPDSFYYPGTIPTEFKSFNSKSGSSILTKITTHSHAGSHVDAPKHAVGMTASVDEYSDSNFYGACRVLDLTHLEKSITRSDLVGKSILKNERILLKTRNSNRGFNKFYDDFIGLTSDAAVYLAEQEIMLIGIDWLGIKANDASDNISHTAFFEKNIPILEGLNLAKALEAEYTLSAFPVAYVGIDGAQVAARLIST